ncbi:MAG: methyltransferase domain-containing protein [Bdellovibrionales bacterium]|nr:methyltransferase domain-containing protein [Bdellovibrionales bacterium]
MSNQVNAQQFLEVECLPGLERFVREEWGEHFREDLNTLETGKLFTGWPPQIRRKWYKLLTVASIHFVHAVPGQRPSALRGDESLRVFQEGIRNLRSSGQFTADTFRISMNGKESTEAKKLKESLERSLNLQCLEGEGELMIRVRRSLYIESGWDLVVRITPLPLSARSWRVANYRGALHSNIAGTIVRMLKKLGKGFVIDPCCGSGTLLCELMQSGWTGCGIGSDLSSEALAACRENFSSFNGGKRFTCFQADGRGLPMRDGRVAAALSNLPWGEFHSSTQQLKSFYPALLSELQRVLKKDGIAVLVTQSSEILLQSLETMPKPSFHLEGEFSVYNGSFRPSVFTLRK